MNRDELTLDDIEDHTKDWLIHVVKQKERIEELEKCHRILMMAYHLTHQRPPDTITIEPVEDCQMTACVAALALLKPDCKQCGDQGDYMVMRPGMMVQCTCGAPVKRRQAVGASDG